MTKVEHTISRERTGAGMDGSITPTCSCGWRGRAEYAHNDYQHSNVREQEQEHIRVSGGFKAGDIIRLHDDEWRVLAVGTYHEKRGHFLHMASTTRMRRVRSTDIPVQVGRFVKRSDLV